MNYKILVNKENKISRDYINNIHLIKIKNYNNEDIYIEEKTYENYLKLKEYLLKENIDIEIDTAYRTVEEQIKIEEEYIKLYGLDYTKKYVAPPGYSEHHTGLAIDIVLNKNGKIIGENKELEKEIETFEKIHNILHNFGFILRYPKGKENITGYNYEAWHIRYVGISTATIIYNNKLILEEYISKYNNGFLVVNKSKNVTSRDVVNEVSKLFNTKKVGHTGTLDPLATGVLILAIGRYTKLSNLIMSDDKEYIATVRVGISTDTLDITGEVLEEDIETVPKNIEEILNSFKKTYLQEVPIYSAVKVNGKKLYQYAREGKNVELPKKEVTIKEIELLEKNETTFKFRCVVSKGTYIRSLIRDIGESINILMTMEDLVRTREYKYTLDNSYTLEDIKNNNYNLLDIEDVFDYPIIEIDESLYKKISNGIIIDNIYNIKDKVIFKYKNNIIAIYENCNNKLKSYYINNVN